MYPNLKTKIMLCLDWMDTNKTKEERKYSKEIYNDLIRIFDHNVLKELYDQLNLKY